MIALCITTNRPDCLAETLASLDAHLRGYITHRVIVDDAGVLGFVPPPGFVSISHPTNQGMAFTVREAWANACIPGIEYVLHWEDDMRLDEDLHVSGDVGWLEAHKDLAQVSYQRHPVNAEESAYGGQLAARVAKSTHPEVHPGYTITDDLFSLNPCLIPVWVCKMGWPAGPIGVGNEDGFTAKCKAAGLRFSTKGTVDDRPPYVTHIGAQRASAWSL